jgi:class 3 adenylate cyclase/tetratricopeptide (TPR) repeat protein
MAVCPSCGNENPEGFNFCGFCSSPLDEAPKTHTEERKVVSVLFVDLVGFTARSHDTDPEDVRAGLIPYHRALTREIERFGGTVEKFIGDAVMAVFGAPVAHEDDAERAVMAALKITEAIAEINEEAPDLNLSFRAAINTGETVFSRVAPQEGDDFIAGDVINVASRLQNVAPVNGIVVGEATYRLTKDVVEYEALDPVMVKGKPRSIPIWRVISARSRFRGNAEVALRTPYIGRAYEQAILKETFHRILHQSSIQAVTIVGEPGVGKTRLLAEFLSIIDEQKDPIYWRQGRSLPYGEGITFWALGEIIKAHAGILESDNFDQTTDKLTSAITSVIKETSEQHWFLSRLGSLVGVEVSGGRSPQKEESFTAWRRFLEAIAEQRPLVLVFEDLHWADPSLMEFIDHLLEWVTGVPMLVVCTARPELYDRHPSWGAGKRNITVVSLSPLNASETTQLIKSLLSEVELPEEAHSALLERAGGNPLYAEEFIRMLADQGILTKTGKSLSVLEDVSIRVPESVHALIAARLDTLSPERKSLLHDASVAGKVFWSGAVAAIGGSGGDLVREGLHELASKEMVRPSRSTSMEGEQEYSFWHALIRDVCYGQIPRASRARKHQEMAAWIETAAERLDDYAEVIAHHYSTALKLAKAAGAGDLAELEGQTRRFLVTAADRALKLDPVKALALYRRALDLLGSDDPLMPRVLREAGTACHYIGLFSEGHSYLEQAIAEFAARQDRMGEAIAVRRLLWLVFRDQGRKSEEARSLAVRAIELLEKQTPGEELSVAYANLAFVEIALESSSEALPWANKAVDVAQGCGGRSGREALAVALFVRGTARFEAGDVGGVEDISAAIDISETEGNAEAAAWSYNQLAEQVRLIDGPLKGLEVSERGHQYNLSHGYVFDALGAQLEGLFLLFELGRWDELLELFDGADELIAWTHEQPGTLLGSWITLCRCLPLFYRGGASEALSVEGTLLPLIRNSAEIDPDLVACFLPRAALLHAGLGDVATALALIKEFERGTDHAPLYRIRYLPDVVRALTLCGDIEWAQLLLVAEENVVFARDRHAAVTANAIVAEAKGEAERALGLYNDAAGRWNEYGLLLEEGQALLGAGRCLLTLGRIPEASPMLGDARKIFATLRAEPLLEETEGRLEQATATNTTRTSVTSTRSSGPD